MSDPSPTLNIDHLARLARLALTEEEKLSFAQQLDGVLRHVEQLSRVDVSGVEPTAHAFPLVNVWADDVAEAGLAAEAALRNAPARRGAFFAVPKVVE